MLTPSAAAFALPNITIAWQRTGTHLELRSSFVLGFQPCQLLVFGLSTSSFSSLGLFARSFGSFSLRSGLLSGELGVFLCFLPRCFFLSFLLGRQRLLFCFLFGRQRLFFRFLPSGSLSLCFGASCFFLLSLPTSCFLGLVRKEKCQQSGQQQ